MADPTPMSAAQLATLRSDALLDALEQLDPTAEQRGIGDLSQVLGALELAELADDDLRRLLEVLVKFADSAAAVDLSGVAANQLARLVAAASPAQLEVAFAKPDLRARLLDEIFARMESHVRAERIRRMHAVVRWRLTGGVGTGGFDRYECTLSDGACTVSREMSERPRVTITVSPVDFVRMVTGQTSPPVLFVTGKIAVKGDLAFAAGLIGYFDLPER